VKNYETNTNNKQNERFVSKNMVNVWAILVFTNFIEIDKNFDVDLSLFHPDQIMPMFIKSP
jgi:hypothetical protein